MASDHALFIYRHMDRSQLRMDSQRFRYRVSAAFEASAVRDVDFVGLVKAQAGLIVSSEVWGYNWEDFWINKPLEEVFTAVTIICRELMRRRYVAGNQFRDAVRSALSDEHLGFKIDDEGIVHFAVDEDFDATRRATLHGLDDPRLKDAREAYESAHKYMDSHPPDTRQAVRRAFEAVEIVARQLAPNHKNLHASLCTGDLKNTCLPLLTTDAVEVKVLNVVFQSMAEWGNGVHFYRHGQPDSAPPSLATAVHLLSGASGYLRLLATVALKALPKG